MVQPALAGAPGQGPRAAGPRNAPEGRGVGRRRQCGDHRGRAGPRMRASRSALWVGGMDEGDGPELGTGVQSSASRPSARRGFDHVQRRHSTLRYQADRRCLWHGSSISEDDIIPTCTLCPISSVFVEIKQWPLIAPSLSPPVFHLAVFGLSPLTSPSYFSLSLGYRVDTARSAM